ncbi:MAG: response regulator [Planctomycetota bacterium]
MTSDRREVLIVDDNPAIHSDFRKILASGREHTELMGLDEIMFGNSSDTSPRLQLPFELTFADQGKAAYEMVKDKASRQEFFSIAFVDMRMPPGWDGVETIRNLWNVDSRLQVVICTAYTDHSWESIVQQLGRSDQLLILKKPFDDLEVIQLATALSEKRRLLDQTQRHMDSLSRRVDQQADEIQAAQEDAERLIESISSVLFSINPNGCIGRWNPVAEEVFSISRTDAVGTPIRELAIDWCDKESLLDLLTHDGTNRAQVQTEFIDAERQVRTLNLRVANVDHKDGQPSRLVLADDISHERLLQSQLDQAQRLESVGQLAAGVAHEINTPMQYIGDNVSFVKKSFARLSALLELLPSLAEGNLSEQDLIQLQETAESFPKPKRVRSLLQQIPEALDDSESGVQVVAKIVAAMKEFSHPGTDEMCDVDLNHVLESTVTVAKNEWKYVADITLNLAPDLPKIRGLPSELNQAFLNIVVNAAHAIGDRVAEGVIEKGSLQITTTLEVNGRRPSAR